MINKSNQFKALSDEDFEKLSTYKTHFTRFSKLILGINQNSTNLRNLNQRVVNTLVYYGYDTEAQDFIDEHNKVTLALHDDLTDLYEVAVELNNDLSKLIEEELENLDKSMDMVKKADSIYKQYKKKQEMVVGLYRYIVIRFTEVGILNLWHDAMSWQASIAP